MRHPFVLAHRGEDTWLSRGSTTGSRTSSVLPGIVVALGTDPSVDRAGLGWRIVIGLLSVCLIASSNYTLNELIDAPFDRHHPTKHLPSGAVRAGERAARLRPVGRC